MSARDGWNAAQRAAERELKKPRKMHGPVGDQSLSDAYRAANTGSDHAWKCCGFHVHAPTCPTQRRSVVLTQPYRNVQITGLTAPEPKRELPASANVHDYLFDQAIAAEHCKNGRVVRLVNDAGSTRSTIDWMAMDGTVWLGR